ncbi:Sister chromatid cohesion protein pds5 [Zancudomyces culisetae]|uniref:Sister chromatid cohesion protein pds5 n=1 Tax=Zancudomyces culisetae TaxID=1213189 RepID=A0A1R1PWD3_ZANCU|nr:Sister chromatid cohesion protein pds5 [Zancudomyces culisetae]|eukprot:OMH85305.1 Sister chromatid cohesion protein pds5 [Zancudomyces culisetae]
MMAEILQQLIEENSKVPKEVIDVLLVQFLKKRQDENRAAHQMAVDVCNSTMTIMQKYVCQYFSEIIVESSRELNREGSAGDVQLENLQNAHYLILELFKTAPGLLQNVIPQIEEELFVDHVDVRTIATQVVGEMFSLRGYVLTKRYEGTWESWKRRRNDKAVAVRIKWVEKAVEMLAMQTQLVKELEDGIIEKLEDVDEKVRKAACEAFSRLELTKNAQIGISKKMVQALSERCKDRRVLPRSEACQAISHIYEGVYSEIEAGDPAVIEKFSEIPAALMKLYFVDQKDITCNVEAALYTKIFGLSSVKDDDKRAMRLVRILTYCDKKAMIGFSGLLKRQGDLVAEVQVMLKFAEMLHKKTTRAREHKESTSGSGGEEEEEDGDSNDVLDAKLEESINRVSAYFPEPLKFANGLSVLLKQKDKDSDKNKDSDMALLAHCGRLRKMMDVSSDYKSIRKEQKEFMRRVCEDSPTIIDTMAMLVRSISLACINKSIIIPLVKIVQKKTNYSVMSRSQGGGSGVSSGLISRNNSSSNIISYSQGSVLGTATATATIAGTTAVTSVPNAAQNLLLLVMKIQPRMFVAHTESLLTLFEDPDIISDQEAEDNLYMISLFSRTYPSQLGYSDKFHRTLSEYVKTGTIKMAKYAATILSTSKKYADYNGENGSLEQLVDEVIDLLLGSAGYSDAKQCKVLLASLSRFVTYKQGVFDTNRLDELAFELFGFLEGRESSRLQMNIIKQEMEVDRNEEELEESIRRKEKAGKTSDANGDKDGWIDRYSLPDAEICKILAIKVLVNRCYSYNNKIKSTESILDEGRKTLFMLRKYTQQQDQLGTQDNTSDDSSSVFKDHLRLTSAACMLKLCRQSRYDQMVVLSDILDLALIVQDPNYNVRFQFVTKKLVESLSALRIKPKFVPLLFFAAYEPEAELRDLIERFIQVTMMDINSKLIKVMASAPTTEDTANSNMFNGIMEYSLIGLLILLTYHPDWDANGQQQQQQQQQEREEESGGNDEPQVDNLTIIKIFSKYIEFYINNVVNAENISLVYFYAMMMKTYRDRYLGYIEPVPQLQPHGLPEYHGSGNYQKSRFIFY